MISQVTVWWKFARFEQTCQHSAAAVILSPEWQPLWEEILIRTFRALCSNTSSPARGPFQHRCLKLGERQKMHKVALAKVGGWPLQVPLVPWAEGSQQGKRAMSMKVFVVEGKFWWKVWWVLVHKHNLWSPLKMEICNFLPALELAATWHCRSFMAPLFSFVLRL